MQDLIRWQGKRRHIAKESASNHRGRDARDDHNPEGTGRELAKNNLKREEDPSNRCIEGSRNPPCCTTGNQGADTRIRHAKELSPGRAESRTDLDDGSLASHGATRADTDRRRDRFDGRDDRADPPPFLRDRQHDFGHSMSFRLTSEKVNQGPKKKSADRRDKNDGRGTEKRAQIWAKHIEKEEGKPTDQLAKRNGTKSCPYPNHQAAQEQH